MLQYDLIELALSTWFSKGQDYAALCEIPLFLCVLGSREGNKCDKRRFLLHYNSSVLPSTSLILIYKSYNFPIPLILQVGDQNRGYLLELMLTKLRYAAGEGSTESSSGESSGTSTSSSRNDPARGIQIVGMSATLPNVAAVADWLQVSINR